MTAANEDFSTRLGGKSISGESAAGRENFVCDDAGKIDPQPPRARRMRDRGSPGRGPRMWISVDNVDNRLTNLGIGSGWRRKEGRVLGRTQFG